MKVKNKIKVFSFRIFIIATTLLILSCKKDKKNTPNPNDVDVWNKNDVSSVNSYLIGKASAPATLNLNPAAGGSITKDGITINFTDNIFAKSNDMPYNGIVKLSLYTVNTMDQMIYRRATTTSNQSGDILISSAMFRLVAKDTLDNQLKVQSGKSYDVQVDVMNNPNDKIFRGRVIDSAAQQVVWEEWPGTTVERGPTGNTLINSLNSFEWCNLDRYMNETPLTHIYVTLPSGFTSANSEVVIRYDGEKASAFLPPNPTLKKFTTEGTHYKVVQNRAAKIMAMSKKDGKFYQAIVPIPSITANHNEIITTMPEVSEAVFNSQIANF
jgi:hypothetical protein